MVASLEDIAKLTRSNGQHVGDMVWWSLSEARIEVKKLAALWTAEGLNPGLLPEVPTKEKALKVAAQVSKTGLKGISLKFTKEDDDELHLVVQNDRKVGDGDLDTVQVNKVVLFKKNGTLVLSDKTDPLLMKIAAEYRLALETHTADDVRRCLVRTLDTFASITLRDKGGVYWVPHPYAAMVRSLGRAVKNIGDSKLYLCPVHNTEEGNASLGESVKGGLETELSALKEELRVFVQGKTPRQETLERRVELYQELKAKAQMYRAILDVSVADLDADLELMAEIVKDLIGNMG